MAVELCLGEVSEDGEDHDDVAVQDDEQVGEAHDLHDEVQQVQRWEDVQHGVQGDQECELQYLQYFKKGRMDDGICEGLKTNFNLSIWL